MYTTSQCAYVFTSDDKNALFPRRGTEMATYLQATPSAFKYTTLAQRLHPTMGNSKLLDESDSLFGDDSSSGASYVTLDRTYPKKRNLVRRRSFQQLQSWSNERAVDTSNRSINALAAAQLLVLRKLSFLQLESCFSQHCPSRPAWDWDIPKLIRRMRPPDYKGRIFFGVPLIVVRQRTGEALPGAIQTAFRWLRANALDEVGIFRKSGVGSRINAIKVAMEELGESIDLDGHQAFDVADVIKQYFRELPEPLLTCKLSQTLITIFQNVPPAARPNAVQWCLLLLPDEHREALQTMLHLLHEVASRSHINQMTAKNLAVCLVPTLFKVHGHSPLISYSPSNHQRNRKFQGGPEKKELDDNKAANDCLVFLIQEHHNIFNVDESMFKSCRFSTMETCVAKTLSELGSELKGGWKEYMNASVRSLLKESRGSRGWVADVSSTEMTEIASKKVGDGHPLKLWRAITQVEAPPLELLRRILRERHIWDSSLIHSRIVDRLDAQSEVYQYACRSMPPIPPKDYCVLRDWRINLPRGACAVVETSIEHKLAPLHPGYVRAVVLASRYLIEPCGSGRSRIVHLIRVDTRGRSPDWYTKSFGHLVGIQLTKLRNSFQHYAQGPESNV